MKKSTVYLLLSIVLLSPLTSMADGNRLLRRCSAAIDIYDRSRENFSRTDFNGAYYCGGLIRGLLDMNFLYQGRLVKKPMFCLPKNNLKTIDGIRAVTRYLRKHPEKLRQGESYLAILALMKSYPCK